MNFAVSQIRDDLRGLFRGRLHLDVVTRRLYATDASLFQVVPAAVAIPESPSDVQTLLRYAHEHSIPVIPRGAGTGLAGESLGPGIVVDLSVHFREITRIGSDSVTCEPGVTRARLQAALAEQVRRFAPDPASSQTCTIGGMVATNASGGNAFRHGYTRDHVQGLRVVWDDGSEAELRSIESSRNPGQERTFPIPATEFRTQEIHAQATALLAQNRELIRVTRPATRFNRCGYVLQDVLTTDGLDLPRLLTGSEGTLGIVTEATLRTVPIPGGTCLAVVGFPALDAAVRAGVDLRIVEGIVACDLLDSRQLAVSRAGSGQGSGDGSIPLPPGVAAALILTFEAETERQAESLARSGLHRLRSGHVHRVLAEPSCEPGAVTRIRRFRESAVAGLYAVGPGARPVSCVEDVGVPAEELGRFVVGAQAALRKFDLAGSVLAHPLTGMIHLRPFVDLANPDHRAKLWPLAETLHSLALQLGGTVSAQHGTGLARTPWVEKQSGPLIPVFRELKRIFDPRGILNPGKIVGPDPSRPAWPLLEPPMEATPLRPTVRTPLLQWDPGELAATANSCNSCGDCRTASPRARMCPVFRATAQESATPRAKAVLARDLFGPAVAELALGPDEVRSVAGLCVNCKMCQRECRAGVDIPKLMLEAKASHHADHGLDREDWVLARAEAFAALAGNFAFTANRVLGNPAARWAIEKIFGVSRHRTLPKFTNRTFLRRAIRAGWTRRERGVAKSAGMSEFPARVALFVDTFANFNDPLVGEAAVAVLEHHGFDVHVPPRQRGSGMAALAQGDFETARETAIHNVRILADLVRDGYQILCPEPTAAVALTQDYLDLLDDPDALLVADHTTELTTFLLGLHDRGKLDTSFRPLDVQIGHHVPCHVKALGNTVAGPRLLDLIPGVRTRTIDVGCSGMAGTWGLKASNYEASLAAGRPVFAELDRPGVMFGSTECGACRMQMQHGTGKRTLHPVQYLALGYGMVPEIAGKLQKPLGKRVTD